MSVKRVYLAGPITGLTYGECTDWREYAKKELEWTIPREILKHERDGSTHVVEYHSDYGTRTDIKTYSPMRMKKHLDNGRPIPGHGAAYDKGSGVNGGHQVVARDRNDVKNADAILMNLAGADRISLGSIVELGWADAWRKFVVVVMEDEGNVHEHIFTQELASVIVSELDDAFLIIKAL